MRKISNFSDFLDALNPNEFDETPVDADTFLYDERYMGKYLKGSRLSEIQFDIFEHGSQIYKHETLVELHGQDEADRLWDLTVKNILMMLGKGSGKDFTSRLMVLYIIYKILCLKEPQQYYGIASTDPIDIVNLALNSDQARTVFFEPLVAALKTSPWFAGRYKALARDVEFDKNVNLYSLHSDPENAEGKNVIVAILDEIDGFTVEGQAASIHKYLSGAVTSRFPGLGKLISLSFPRTKDGFIMSLYNDVVEEVDTVEYTHEFLVNEKIDPDAPGNKFTVTWTEDRILRYRRDNYYALKAPTFRVNPNRRIEDYKDDFETDRQNNDTDTLMRVCANPPDHDSTSFFTNHDLIEDTFSVPNGWDQDTIKVKSNEDAEYFIHVDLSKVSDRTVVAMGHVSDWIAPNEHARVHEEPQPFITIDLFRVWEPTRLNPVDDAEVMTFIVSLTKKFPVKKVTFDQWQSFDNIQYLESIGVESEKNSLRREEYMEFRTAMYEQRMIGPYDEKLHKELKNLILVKTGNGGKVDHPKGKEHFNDISEAVCGVTVNCIRYSTMNKELQLFTMGTVKDLYGDDTHDTIEPKRQMPGNLQAWMQNDDGWEVI